jgi:charged multivesicular body protein 2A
MNLVEWAFGKRMTPAERLRKHQRALEKTQRELDRERVKLENQEKKLVADIKKSAKNGQMGPLRIQAKDLVRTRRYARCSTGTEGIAEIGIGISRSSIRCGHNCRQSRCESRYAHHREAR